MARLPWWRFLARSALKDEQQSWFRAWRDSALLGGENSQGAQENRARYEAHVREHGLLHN